MASKLREAATAEKSSAGGNGATMREALESMIEFDASEEAAMADGLTDAERIAEYADHIVECQKKAKAALAAPPRNCDVGTADEQNRRFELFCIEHRTYENGCGDCPCKGVASCELAWAQMPYEEGGEK